ncbi:MAG: hypothetical protein HXY41_00930 [Chloroflexi bacterium]|nr:hypothetical protein [Chloroflexota bacterium]
MPGALGVAGRFANQPDLDPMSPADRVIVARSFTPARRERMMTGLRIQGAADAKRQNGGYGGRVRRVLWHKCLFALRAIRC